MNVTLNWLKEYVKLDDSVKINEIVDKLTLTGTKVETYKEFGIKVDNVYTGKIDKIDIHPRNDKLKILSIDIGSKKLTAVANIPDIEVGDIVPIALPGAKIFKKDVVVSDVDGVISECMVCHVLDLGLDKSFEWCKSSGLISFPNDVKIGEDVNSVLGLGDYLIEFEITPNRPDCLSIEGIAKELAVTFNTECKELWQYKDPKFKVASNIDGISAKVESDNCKRYMLGVGRNITVMPSPYDMQLKLIKCGIRPINNIVDITNYVMLELGEPLHAFDRELLSSDNIVVREALPDEKIVTLDGVERNLDEDTLVITNGKVPVAIAGVIGGEQFSINENTKNVVIESATFVRGNVRNTTKRQILRTDASLRYEKGLPTELVSRAINRVFNLLNSVCCADISESVIDIYPESYIMRKIKMDYEKINGVIGMMISSNIVDEILESLGIKVEEGHAYIPYFREDLEQIEDLAEEVARIYGYDKLPSIMPKSSLTFGEKTKYQKIQEKLVDMSVGYGFNEIYTYTFFSMDRLKRMCISDNNNLLNCIRVKNPLSKDFEYMRTTTMPLMLEALERNYTRKNSDVKLFEIGKVFIDNNNIKNGELVNENLVLTYGMYGIEYDFYDIKNMVECVLYYYNILNLDYELTRIESKDEYHPGISAKITIGDDVIAEFGKLSPLVAANYYLPENTYIASIYLDKLTKYENKDIKFEELPKYPAVERDIAFVIDKEILSRTIEKELSKVDFVEKVELFDVYEGKQIESNKKSMAYRILLRSYEKTLEENEITSSMNKIIEILDSKFNSKVRE